MEIHLCVLQDIGPLGPLPCSPSTSSADHSKQGIGYRWPCAILGWLVKKSRRWRIELPGHACYLYICIYWNCLLIYFFCLNWSLSKGVTRPRYGKTCAPQWLRIWMNEWMNEWMNKWMDVWLNKCMNEWMNAWMNKLMYGWMNDIIDESPRRCNQPINQTVKFSVEWEGRRWGQE